MEKETNKNQLKALSLTANDLLSAQERFYHVVCGASFTAERLSESLKAFELAAGSKRDFGKT